jgi:hypothetical protein
MCQSSGFAQVGTISAFSIPTAARARHPPTMDMGRAKAQLGELEAAKEALRRAFALDEELKLEAVKDDRLSAV